MSQEMTYLEEALRSMLRQAEAADYGLAYLVLDHSVPHTEIATGLDGQGRSYAAFCPAVLDALGPVEDHPVAKVWRGEVPISLTGVPIYRRADLPPGWPEDV